MKIELCATTTGIGDHVTAVYTACGLANAGHEVVFYSKYPEWLSRVKHPNLTIEREAPCDFSVYWRYDEELVAAQKGTCKSRADWYAANTSEYYGIPLTEPSKPNEILPPTEDNPRTKGYVLIAPFSAGMTRAWEDAKWQFLAEDLIAKGMDVVAVCSKKEAPILARMFNYLKQVEQVAGADPDKILNLIHYADHIVANDSSIAHLSALLRKKVVVVCAHVKPEFVFGAANEYVTTVSPNEMMYPCTWCCWTHDGGFRYACLERCDALQSIEHDKVIKVLRVD